MCAFLYIYYLKVKDCGCWRTYKDDLNGFFKLKDNSNVNKDLNALAKLAEIDKRISFHTARHTNATLLIYSGANITTVQKLLGHKSVKTTQVYANIMDMTIVHDLEKAAYSKLANRPKSWAVIVWKCPVFKIGFNRVDSKSNNMAEIMHKSM